MPCQANRSLRLILSNGTPQMTTNHAQVIRLHPSDNVIVALADLATGRELPEYGLTLVTAVPRGHKVALTPVAVGEQVIRYGQIIGLATVPIAAGEHILETVG